MDEIKYQPIKKSELPGGLRFDVPGQNQGQHIEVAYADYPAFKAEARRGSAYMRVHDLSDQTVAYLKLLQV